MITLRPAHHTLLFNTVVEIWDDDNFIGAIYPSPRGVRIISKYIEARDDLLLVDPDEPPAILVNLKHDL